MNTNCNVVNQASLLNCIWHLGPANGWTYWWTGVQYRRMKRLAKRTSVLYRELAFALEREGRLDTAHKFLDAADTLERCFYGGS